MTKNPVVFFKSNNEKFQDSKNGITYNYWYDLPTCLHTHEFFEIFIQLTGPVKHIYNQREYVVESGNIVLIRPKDLHQIIPFENSPAKQFNISIREDLFSYLTNFVDPNLLNKIMNNVQHISLQLNRVEFNYIHAFVKRLVNYNANKLSKNLELLSLLLLNSINSLITDSPLPSWLYAFIEKINSPEYFTCPIKELYKLTYYSQPQFSVLFKKYLGTTLTNYMANVKIEYACTLLSHSKFSILNISEKAGFNSLSNFNHVFKKIKGSSPTEFRKQIHSDY